MSGDAMPTSSDTEDPTRAIIYLRVSTKEQAETGGEAEGYSIPAQRDACRRKAEQLGAVVVEEFADRGESARSSDRPELQRMLTYVGQHPVSYAIVHKVDRLARNRVDDVEINLALHKAGVTLVSCTENIDETPSGMLLHGIMSSIAEFYSRNLASEVIKGSVQKAKTGGTIGKAPTGYLNVRRMENGQEMRTVEIDPARGPLMRWAFEEYATGRWTLRDLLAEVTKRGLDTTTGPHTPSKPLVLSHFHTLLRHPYYKGIVRYRGVEYPGRHQPLVSAKTWQRVQELLDQKGTSGEKQRIHHHYLKGTVFCGRCGSRLIVSHNRGQNGTIYPYFICIGRQQRRTDCTQKAVLIPDVELLVEDHYATIQPGPKLLDQLRVFLTEELDAQRHLADEERRMQQGRIATLKDERHKLLEAHYADAVPLELLRTEQARISTGLQAAEERLTAISVEHDVVAANLERALRVAADWHAAYLGAGPTVRRQLNQAIFKKIYVDDAAHARSELAEPFELLLSDEVTTAARAWDKYQDPTEPPGPQDDGKLLRKTDRQGELATAGASLRPSLSYETLVGAAGLEPATSSL